MAGYEDFKSYVVIPAYNEADNLPALLASIASQPSPFPHEVIVADNGSTDRTADVARGLGAHVVPAAIRGIGPARQAALGYALNRIRSSGLPAERTVIMQTDADCRLLPGYVRAVIGAFALNPDLQVGVGPCVYDIPFENEQPVRISSGKRYQEFSGNPGLAKCCEILGHNILDYVLQPPVYYLPGPNTTYRASLFFNYPLQFAQDRRWEMADMSLRIQHYINSSEAIAKIDGQQVQVSPRAFLADAPVLTRKRLDELRRTGLGVYTPDSTVGSMLDTVRQTVTEMTGWPAG